MAILVDEVRTERCAGTRPSVREVCLVGVSRPSPNAGWRRGDWVTFAGRAYRVEATRARAGRADEPARYLHLQRIDETD